MATSKAAAPVAVTAQIEMVAPRKKGESGSGRPCLVCQHRQRVEIEADIVSGVSSNVVISRKFETSWQSIWRHRTNHMASAAIQAGAQAAAVEEGERGASLLEQAQALARDARGILDGATKDGQRETALKAIREVSRLIELQGKLLGTIDTSTTVNVLMAPVLIELQQVIMQALAPFADARQAVVLALGRLSGREDRLTIEHQG